MDRYVLRIAVVVDADSREAAQRTGDRLADGLWEQDGVESAEVVSVAWDGPAPATPVPEEEA